MTERFYITSLILAVFCSVSIGWFARPVIGPTRAKHASLRHASLRQINHACDKHGGLDSVAVDGPVSSVGSYTAVYCNDLKMVVLP